MLNKYFPLKLLRLSSYGGLVIYWIFSVTRRSRSDESHSLTELLSNWVSVSIDFTDVTLVSDDTYKRLNWSDPDDPDDPDESYLVMKVIQWWKLSSGKGYIVMKVS